MSTLPNGGTIDDASIKWKTEYRSYRSSQCLLYISAIVFMVFITLSVVCATFLFKNSFNFHPIDYEINGGESRAVRASTLFCEGITLTKANFQRNLIVIRAPLRRRAVPHVLVDNDLVFVRRDRVWYRSFYLLEDLKSAFAFEVNIRPTSIGLKGEKLLTASSRVDFHDFTGTRMSESFTVNEDNSFYLGLTSIAGNREYSDIFLNISIWLMEYDTSSNVTSCGAAAGKICDVSLRFNTPETALIVVPNNKTVLSDRDVWVTWYCEPRIWFYAAVFGGSFVLIIFFVTCVYHIVMWRVRRKICKWKPTIVIVYKKKSFQEDTREVLRTSVNARAGLSDMNCDNSTKPNPSMGSSCKIDTVDNKTIWPMSSTPNGSADSYVVNKNILLNNVSGPIPFNDANYANFVKMENVFKLRRSLPPRWSTFSSEDDYIECVTNFRESPSSTLESMKKASDDDNFEAELDDRFQSIPSYNNEPFETDIDSDEAFPFINANENSEMDVLYRQKRNNDKRWEPRLSVVTEV
ncbi:uncharacterized protein LOC124445143 [Xenia sp. Carnegie-2017]|uniref:uncharacterized protein LOC124445143 n=1 Tax=Xenia sp. Carnegie-2017 TaxID=2897299 RepID=UPI001F04E38F|nr:uncharacterized protein LOC124445143 [Xenia sp. Carnegie-2017]